MNGYDWFLVAYWIVCMVILVAMVGKPREPIGSRSAAVSVLIFVALITGLLISRGAL